MRTTRTFFFIVALSVGVLSAAGCAGFRGDERIQASGEVRSWTVAADDFDAVEIHGPFDVAIVAGGRHVVDLEVDEALADRVDVVVADGVLRLDLDDGVSLDGPVELRATVRTSAVRGLMAKGAAEVTSWAPTTDDVLIDLAGATAVQLDGLAAPRATVRVDGASELSVTAVAAAEIEIDVRGASRVTLAGSADAVDIDAHGASEVSTPDLSAHDVDVEITGASRVVVHATGRVRGSINGASELRISGDPQLDVDSGGASTVRS